MKRIFPLIKCPISVRRCLNIKQKDPSNLGPSDGLFDLGPSEAVRPKGVDQCEFLKFDNQPVIYLLNERIERQEKEIEQLKKENKEKGSALFLTAWSSICILGFVGGLYIDECASNRKK